MSGKSMPVDLDHVKPFMGFCTASIYIYIYINFIPLRRSARCLISPAAHSQIENCKKELATDLLKHGHVIGMYWENIARSMVERASGDAQELDKPLFCVQTAEQRQSTKKTIDKQLTHQLLTVLCQTPTPRTG